MSQTDYSRLQEQHSIRMSIYDKNKPKAARVSVMSEVAKPKLDKRRESLYYAQFDVFLGPQM